MTEPTTPDPQLPAVHSPAAQADHQSPYHPQAWIVGDPVIGGGTWIGAFTVIDGSGGLTIGSGCDISSGAHIYTHSSVRRCVSGRRFEQVERRPVTIGDQVFVGANAVIMMGVTIGAQSVVAAGAVVSKDVAPRTVVAGVPATKISDVVFDDAGMPTFAKILKGPSS